MEFYEPTRQADRQQQQQDRHIALGTASGIRIFREELRIWDSGSCTSEIFMAWKNLTEMNFDWLLEWMGPGQPTLRTDGLLLEN